MRAPSGLKAAPLQSGIGPVRLAVRHPRVKGPGDRDDTRAIRAECRSQGRTFMALNREQELPALGVPYSRVPVL
jgi:hypothetical protein